MPKAKKDDNILLWAGFSCFLHSAAYSADTFFGKMERPNFSSMSTEEVRQWGKERVDELAPIFENISDDTFEGYTDEQREVIQEYLDALYAKNTDTPPLQFNARRALGISEPRLQVVEAAA